MTKSLINELKKLKNEKKKKEAKKACIDTLFPAGASTKECIAICLKKLQTEVSTAEMTQWKYEYEDSIAKRAKEACMNFYFDNSSSFKEIKEGLTRTESVMPSDQGFPTNAMLARWGKEWNMKYPDKPAKKWEK